MISAAPLPAALLLALLAPPALAQDGDGAPQDAPPPTDGADLLAPHEPGPGADVTAIPPRLRGTAGLRWTGAGDAVSIVEGDETVGRRTTHRHDLSLDLAFAPLPGVALAVELPMVLSQGLTWSQADSMAFDPNLGAGSLAGGAALATPPAWRGGGFGQPLVAVQLSPFHQQRLHARADRTSWLIEAGYRFQDKSSWWQEQADSAGATDRRGGGDGADALHLRTAFSTTRATSRPYLQATFDRAFTVPTQLRATDGSVLGSAEVRPASRYALRAGAEIPASTTDTVEVAFDLGLAAGYRSWQDIPSGLYLPDVLDASREVLVTQGEAVWLDGVLGLQVRVLDKVDIITRGQVGTESPYRVEHPYAVDTDFGAIRWSGEAQVRVWLADPLLQPDSVVRTASRPSAAEDAPQEDAPQEDDRADDESEDAPVLAPAPIIKPLPPADPQGD